MLRFIKSFDLKLIRSHFESTKFLENKPSSDLWDNAKISLLSKRVLLRQLKVRYYRALVKLETSSVLATDKFIDSRVSKLIKPTLTNSKLDFKWSELVSNDSIILSKFYNSYADSKKFNFIKKGSVDNQPSGSDIFLNMSSMEFVSQIKRLSVQSAVHDSSDKNNNLLLSSIKVANDNLGNCDLPCADQTSTIPGSAWEDSALNLFLLRSMFKKSKHSINHVINEPHSLKVLTTESAEEVKAEPTDLTEESSNRGGLVFITLEDYKKKRYMDPEPEVELRVYPSSDDDMVSLIKESDTYYEKNSINPESHISLNNYKKRTPNLEQRSSFGSNSAPSVKRVMKSRKLNKAETICLLKANSIKRLFKRLHLSKLKLRNKPTSLHKLSMPKEIKRNYKNDKYRLTGIGIVSALRNFNQSISLPPRLNMGKLKKKKLKVEDSLKKDLINPPIEIKNMMLLYKKRVLRGNLSNRIGITNFIKKNESQAKDKVLQYFFMRKKKKIPTNSELKSIRIANGINVMTGVPVDYYKLLNKSKGLDP